MLAIGPMSSVTMEGQYDTYENRNAHLVYHRMYIGDTNDGEESSVYFGKWQCYSLYVHDFRLPNGAMPQGYDNAFNRVHSSFQRLCAHKSEAAGKMIKYPNGDERPGSTVPHVVGGAFAIERDVYFVNRCSKTGRKYLLCNVY